MSPHRLAKSNIRLKHKLHLLPEIKVTLKSILLVMLFAQLHSVAHEIFFTHNSAAISSDLAGLAYCCLTAPHTAYVVKYGLKRTCAIDSIGSMSGSVDYTL